MADTTLTNKVRNPRDLNQWMDIWTATVKDDKSYIISPSGNWNISADNLGQIPVNKISPVNFQDNIEGTEKNYTTTNVTITSEPVDDNLGLSGGVALTKTDGSINERPFDNKLDSYLNGKGEFVSLPSYSLTGATDTSNTSNVKVTLNKNNEVASDIIINGSGKITTTYNSNIITLNLAQNSIGTNELADKSVTVNKIDWDSNTAITSKIKQKIGINSSTNDGMVSATNGNSNNQKAWATDNNGNPNWRSGKVTVKEQNIELIKYATNFIRGFYDGGPINDSFVPSPSSVPEEPTNLTGTGSSYLFLINGTLGASDADYKMVFNTQKALYEDNDLSPHLNITENNVTKNVVYE